MNFGRWFARRIGRRGASLILFGVLHLSMGYRLITGDPVKVPGMVDRYGLLWVWGVGWVVCGLIAIAHCGRRGPGGDVYGFHFLTIPAAAWCVLYLISWAIGLNPNGWSLAITWGMLLGVIWIDVSWPEASGHAPPDLGSCRE